MTNKNIFEPLFIIGSLTSLDGSEEEEGIETNPTSDRQKLKLEVRPFPKKLKPPTQTPRTYFYNKNKHKYNNRNNSGKYDESDVNNEHSVDECNSCDSFISCHSSLSDDTLRFKEDFESNFRKMVNTNKSKINARNSNRNNVTILNKIFLSNRGTQLIKNDKPIHVPKDMEKRCKMFKDIARPSKTFLPSKMYSSKVCGGRTGSNSTIVMRPKRNPFCRSAPNALVKSSANLTKALAEEILDAQASISKSLRASPRSKTVRLTIDKVLNNSRRSSGLRIHFSTPVNTFKHDTPNYCKTMEFKLPEPNFEENLPPLLNSVSSVVLEIVVSQEQRRKRVIPGCEQDLKMKNPKQNFVSLLHNNSDIQLRQAEYYSGDGDCFNNDYILQKDSEVKNNEQALNAFDDSHLRTFVREILKKIKKESPILPSTSVENIFNGAQRCAPFEEETAFDDQRFVACGNSNPNKTKLCLPNISVTKRSKHIESEPNNRRKNMKNDGIGILGKKELKKEELESKEICSTVLESKVSCRRAVWDRTNLLPVIEEESSEESSEEVLDASSFSEEDSSYEFCLVDSEGRPIRLFDSEGLPLTDASGRPLRFSHGELLMKCDASGIPLVNSKSCTIFDSYGCRPLEGEFDPSSEPEGVNCATIRLTTRDGLPLMLFDGAGRPLTSISGTILVDSQGHTLVQIS